MSDILSESEVAGLRKDMEMLLGIDENTGAETLARTTVSIYRPATNQTFNAVTMTYSGEPSLIYAGPAHFGPMVFRRDRGENSGEELARVRVYRCWVPHDAGDIHIDDYVVVDTSDDMYVGSRSLWVTDVMYESEIAMRRITLTDVTRDKVPT